LSIADAATVPTVVARRRGPLNRLSVGLQIGFLRMAGRTLNSFQILPVAVLKHLGAQLRLARRAWRLASIRALYRRQRTLFDHQRIAMEVLRFGARISHTTAFGGISRAMRPGP
jgi:hypothetical protein